MYDKNNTMDKVDEARLDLFAWKQRPYDGIPPTSTALMQHVKWFVYQAGSIWGQATVCKMQTESPANWGWQKADQAYTASTSCWRQDTSSALVVGRLTVVRK
ncbi:hypothetical protein Pmani_000958 [Petrolisthes manimaculis]|uniref:Uncharacterized protein n=1 Tax=Petrolisthes manimaculis TaxID=1843537 RepID=A0AAE1QLR3_9EUCA|nr:hypothetical protein Pmani_000958 [Petrolisthes manimaculis]